MKIKAKDLVCKCGNANPSEFQIFYEVQASYELTAEDGEIRAVRSSRDLNDVEDGWARIFCAVCTNAVHDLDGDMLPWSEEDK